MRFNYFLVTILFLPVVGLSATIYVPDNYATIQGAIDASASGDTIIVRPGTYVENIDFVGKAVHLESEQGAASTTIDGNQSSCVVLFNSNEGKDSILEGFTLTNGSGIVISGGEQVGGGICCISASPAIVANTVLENNAVDWGGGIYCQYSEAGIINNIFSANSAYRGGGIYCDEVSNMTIAQNTIVGNDAFMTGAISIDTSSSVLICDNHIENNVSDRHGGVRYRRSGGVIENNTFIDNNDNFSYGQITVWDCDSKVTINNNKIFMTSVQPNTKGIFCEESFAVISSNTINGHGSVQGGGIYIKYCSPLVVSNVIGGNMALFEGGGIFGDGTNAIITNNVIMHNDASRGGGISFDWHSSPVVSNNVIIGNHATEYGGGIHGFNASSPETIEVVNTVLWGNDAPQGAEIAIMGLGLEVLADHSDIAGGQSAVYIENNCILTWGTANIDADPQFVDPASDDYHLTWNSPCRDAGDILAVSLTFDFENDPRIVGSTVDMGADEFYYHLYHIGDVIPGSPIDVKVVGYPAAPVFLALGSGIQDPPYNTQHGDFWLTWPSLWQANIGTVPGDGIKVLSTTVPTGWASASEHPLQALVGPWGGAYTLLTNPMILTVE